MLGKDVDDNKKYTATYEFVFFNDKPMLNGKRLEPQERKVITTTQCWSGFPSDIALAVKYYMGHYGAIQGKLIGEYNEITN